MSTAARPVAIVVAAVMFISILEGTIISTALPHMARDFDVAPVDLGAGITAYLLVSAMFLPVSGWIAERFGTKRVLVGALIGFALASLLCGASNSLVAFVAARALQAFFASLMMPVANLVLLRVTPKHQLVQATAISTTPALIAPVLGPPLGGFITEAAGWRYIFYINLPLAAIAVLLVLRLVPNLSATRRDAFDRAGFVLMSAALAGVVLGMDRIGAHPADWEWPSLLVGGALLLAVLAIIHLRRKAQPIVSLSALRHRTFTAVAFGPGFIMRLPFMGQALLLPLYLQVGFGFSPLATGILLLLQNLGDLLLKPVAGRALRLLGFRLALISGTATMMAGLGAMALLDPGMPFWLLSAAMLLTGAARSIAFTAMVALTFADIPEDELAGATVLNSIGNALSAAMGISLSALILNAAGDTGLGGYRAAILLLALLGACAIPLFARLPSNAGAEVSGRRAPVEPN